MKTVSTLSLAAALFLSACATVPNSERVTLLQRRVSPELYHKVISQKPLSEADVIELSRRGLPNSSIIYYIYITKSYYSLTRADVRRLERKGVSGDVVSFMVDNKPRSLITAFFDL
ncbi:MAG: hypothetical protein JWL59_1906 [Chthoniobacteraceae bacterium]|nr:hypothetical protein [Chthoniobacteraceae bacterium]